VANVSIPTDPQWFRPRRDARPFAERQGEVHRPGTLRSVKLAPVVVPTLPPYNPLRAPPLHT